MKSFLEVLQEEESSGKHHVMAFGRMNPPTTGHLKVIDKVKEIAKKHNAEHSVVTSHSQDSKKNPLSASQKIKHLKRYSSGTHFVASSKEHPTFLHHAAELHKKGVTHLHMVAGSDRVAEYKKKLNQYNGTHKGALYNFKKIQVHSAGHRDPDSEDSTEGMSGTKMREHAKNKDIKSFKKGVPSHVSDEHAKELMHDTRKGMGLHENVDRGMFKAIFVSGGPGSGKDIVIREAISESKIVELNFVQAKDYLADKQKLSEKTNDFRREAIRNRGPLIVNGPADDTDRISYIKEELEELGYETMMVFVNTTNEASKERNSLLSRMMVESVRQDKWLKSQKNTKYFDETFNKFISFDNTGDIDSKEEDIHDIYQKSNEFLASRNLTETALDWLNRNGRLNINSLYKEQTNVKSSTKFIQSKTGGCKGHRFLADNNCPGCQLQRKQGRIDTVKDGDTQSNSGYTFRTYEETGPKVKVQPATKKPAFQKDKDQINKKRWVNSASGAMKPAGLSPEFDTRQQGTVYPMSGMGDVAYKEQKEFKNFKKFIEAIDDPGGTDMGVGGVLGGASNKEPMETLNDRYGSSSTVIKKKLKFKNTEK
jgi:cytidyltransferase-like protein